MPLPNMKTLQDHVDLFVAAKMQSGGHNTGVHAGIAALRADIAAELLEIRHDPAMLVDALMKLRGADQ
jgi:hypothetical protein